MSCPETVVDVARLGRGGGECLEGTELQFGEMESSGGGCGMSPWPRPPRPAGAGGEQDGSCCMCRCQTASGPGQPRVQPLTRGREGQGPGRAKMD